MTSGAGNGAIGGSDAGVVATGSRISSGIGGFGLGAPVVGRPKSKSGLSISMDSGLAGAGGRTGWGGGSIFLTSNTGNDAAGGAGDGCDHAD